MNVLVTGALGFFGKEISAHLIGKSNVISLGIEKENDIICDLSKNIPKLEIELEMVVHAAGKAHLVPKDKKEAQAFYDVNVNGTRNLLTALDKTNNLPVSLCFISSVAVYGLETGESISEETELNGNTPYALSKIEAEVLVLEWGKRNNVNILVLRLPLLVGQNPPGNLGQMIQAINKGYYFRIGDGRSRRSMVLAADVAGLITHSQNMQGVFNLTDGYHPTYCELENAIAIQSGRHIKTIPGTLAGYAARLGDFIPGFPINSIRLTKLTQSLTFSDEKARNLLGWKPRPVIEHFKI